MKTSLEGCCVPMGRGSQEVRSIAVGSRLVGPGHPVVIIAEIGVNHEGSAEVCARMIEAAAKAGADAIKLQTIDADENYVQGTDSYALFSGCGLSREETHRMFDLARELGVEPFTTAGDFATLDWVDGLAPAAHKISSGLFTNLAVIRHAARTGRPLLMSTGMANVGDIDAAVAAAQEGGASGFALLQCTSLYPAPPETLNLATIGWLERRYEVPVGLSDHSLGIKASVLSVGAGARLIEKHFTLDPSRPGCDHHLSLDPDGFAEMVRRVRAAEVMMGQAGKRISKAERRAAAVHHRVVVARRDIAAGETFDAANLALKRPLAGSNGLAPRHYDAVIGQRAVRALRADEPVPADAVEGDL